MLAELTRRRPENLDTERFIGRDVAQQMMRWQQLSPIDTVADSNWNDRTLRARGLPDDDRCSRAHGALSPRIACGLGEVNPGARQSGSDRSEQRGGCSIHCQSIEL